MGAVNYDVDSIEVYFTYRNMLLKMVYVYFTAFFY